MTPEERAKLRKVAADLVEMKAPTWYLMDHESEMVGTLISERVVWLLDRITELEALVPCEECGGSGVRTTLYHGLMGMGTCPKGCTPKKLVIIYESDGEDRILTKRVWM